MKLGSRFEYFDIPVEDRVTIHGARGGQGPPLLLLHGFPQTHLIWHKIADKLAQSYTVIALDLRGYGNSSKAPGDAEHKRYSKSTMVRDCVKVMEKLGHERYFVCGHDRGGRVAHKLCIDYPEQVTKVMLLDICPTLAMYEATDQLFATAYYHWFFLIQPSPFPEDLIMGNPAAFARKAFQGLGAGAGTFHPEALEAYSKMLADKEAVHAMCEDYRAAATIDLQEQKDDIEHARQIKCPLRVLWGKKGLIEKKFDAVQEWSKVAEPGMVEGSSVDSGHYIPEEAPDELLQDMLKFFRG